MGTETHYRDALNAWGQDPRRLQEEPEEFLYALTQELNDLDLEIGMATACIDPASAVGYARHEVETSQYCRGTYRRYRVYTRKRNHETYR